MICENDKKNDFISALNKECCISKFQEISHIIEHSNVNETSVNQAVGLCIEALRFAADPLFLKQKMLPLDNRYANNREKSVTLTGYLKSFLEVEINIKDKLKPTGQIWLMHDQHTKIFLALQT